MIRRAQTVSLRTLLLGLAVGAVVYVLTLILEITLVIAPAAAVNRSHAGALLREHLAIRQHMNTLEASLDRLGTAFDTTTARGRTLERREALALSRPITARFDSVVAMRTSLHLSPAPPNMRRHLAMAVETETNAGLTMLDAVRAMEAGRTRDAVIAVQRAESLLDSTALNLEAAEGSALTDLITREDRLFHSARLVSRWRCGGLCSGPCCWRSRSGSSMIASISRSPISNRRLRE